MIKAELKSYGSYITDSVYQWDLNQELTINGLVMSSAPVIAFSSKAIRKAIIVQSKITDGVIKCEIPNALLQFDDDITAHLCSMENKQYKVVEKIIIPVYKRAMPANYQFTDNVPILTYESMEADIQAEIDNERKRVNNLVDVERKRIDNIINSQPVNAGNTDISTILIHGYGNNSTRYTANAFDMTLFTTVANKNSNLINSLNTKSITIKKKGIYHLTVRLRLQYFSTTNRFEIASAVNDTQDRSVAEIIMPTVTDHTIVYNCVLTLNAGDKLSVQGKFLDENSKGTATVSDAIIYAIDWEGKIQISNYSSVKTELEDIRVGVDGTIYDNAGQAVREQFKKKEEDISSLKEDLINLTSSETLDTDVVLQAIGNKSGYLNSNGSFVSDSLFHTLVYDVSVINRNLHVIGKAMGNAGVVTRYGFFKDLDLTSLIKKSGVNTGWNDSYEEDVTVPMSCYLAVSCQDTTSVSVKINGNYRKTSPEMIVDLESKKLSKNFGAKNYGKILGISIDGTVYPKDISTVKVEKSQILTVASLISSKYIKTNGETEDLSNYTIYLYAVNTNTNVKITSAMVANPSAALRYAFYSSSDIGTDTLIKKGTLNSGGWSDRYEEEVSVPDNATILAISSQTGNNNVVIKKWLEESLAPTNMTWLYGKKIGICGDSMAKGNGTYDNNCWAERIASRNNMNIDNQSINGKYLTQGKWSDSVIGGQVDALSSDCDVVVIYGGTNDITAHIAIGDDDSADTTTLNGTMNVLIPKLKNKFPSARIVFITPYRRYERNDNGSYTEVWSEQLDWINALNKKCNEYGIPCWNNAVQGQILWDNDAQRKYFTGTDSDEYGDDYHLNNDGLEFVSYLYEQFIINPITNIVS